MNQVAHTNLVTWTHALDPNAMRRPASYSTSGASQNWSSGAYADAGNVTAIGANSYVYDPVSRLTSASQYTNPTNTYAYEPLGMTRNIVASGVETVHLYTADDERVWTFQPGAPSRWTIRDLDGKVLREFKNSAGTWSVERDYVYRDGALLAADTPAERVHYHPDHLGTPRLITGAAGGYRAYHLYHPYGAEATGIGQDGERLKFTAHERDLGNLGSAADDIDYMHARFYQPQVGRFMGVDPILGKPRGPQSWNRYSYVRSNPLRNIDPTGELTGSAIADAMEGPMRELKEELMYGLSDGTAFGIIASTLSGASVDLGLAVVDVLRVGESSGDAIGSGAGAWDTTVAVGKDVLRGAAIAAPAAGVGRAVAARAAGRAAAGFASSEATSAAQGVLLRSLASQQQMAELTTSARTIAGPGSAARLRDAPRLANQYGGRASDWVKISSSTYRATDGSGRSFSTHAYMNIRTGQIVEPKTVFGR